MLLAFVLIMSSQKRRCCIIGCNTVSTDTGRRLFSFPPKNTLRYEEWLKLCWESFENISILKQPKICDLHFESQYFGKSKLYPHSIPSLKLSEIDEQVEETVNQNDECNDLKLEDLNYLSSFPISSTSTAIEATCKFCHKREENLQYYRRREGKLLKENNRLKSLIKNLKTLCKSFKCKIKRIKMKTIRGSTKANSQNIMNEMDSLEVNSNTKTFCKMLLGLNRQYSSEEKILSQAIFFKSSAVYNFLREKLKLRLPSLSSIYTWLPIKELTPGPNFQLFEVVKESISRLDDKSRQVVLMFDEISIKRDLRYNKHYDRIDGFVDFGKGGDGRKLEIGKSICVFMLSSLFGNWKQVIYYIIVEKNAPTNILKEKLFEIINICDMIGLNVRAVVCDQATANQKTYKNLGVTIEEPYFKHGNKKVFCLFDIPHLFKSIRNNLMKYNLVTSQGEKASWNVLRELYNIEKASNTKMCPKLTNKHIHPNRFEKMSVKLAVQAISASTVAAIRTTLQLGRFSDNTKEHALSTADCFEKLNNLFDCCNSKSLIAKSPYKSALMENNISKNYLKEMKDYVKKLYFETGSNKVKINCLNGLSQSIEAILKISDEIFLSSDEIFFLCTNKLNQDRLENLFSVVRYKKKNPTVGEFNEIISRIVSVKLIYSSKFGNCEEDDTDNLLLDWNAVVNPVNEQVTNFEENNETHKQSEMEPNLETLTLTEENSELASTSFENSISDNATMYFAGYVLSQNFKKSPFDNCEICKSCMSSNTTDLSRSSEWLVYYKNFSNTSDFGALIIPTEEFFQVCKTQVQIFKEFFENSAHHENIIKTLVNICSNKLENWYQCDHHCYAHRIKILEFFLLVLLRKNCTWKMNNIKCAKDNEDFVNTRLNILKD